MANSTTRIGPARLRRVGRPGPDTVTWATRASVIAVVVAAGVVAWASLAPIEPAPVTGSLALPRVDKLAQHDAPSATARGELIAQLSSAHVFSQDRSSWGAPDAAELAEATPEPLPVSPPALLNDEGTAPTIMKVDTLESVDTQTKASFETIRLRAIVTLGNGRPGALLGFAHSKEADRSQKIAEGERFVVPRQKDKGEDEWTLLRVDTKRNHVYVRRESTTLGIALFPDQPVEAGEVTIAATSESPGDAPVQAAVLPERTPDGRRVPRIERAEQAQVLEEIRKRAEELQGKEAITLDDLAELMALTAEDAAAKPKQGEDKPEPKTP